MQTKPNIDYFIECRQLITRWSTIVNPNANITIQLTRDRKLGGSPLNRNEGNSSKNIFFVHDFIFNDRLADIYSLKFVYNNNLSL